MAHFTEAQANSSKLESCRKEFTDGNFAYWVLRVSGSDGQYHQFVDHDHRYTLGDIRSICRGY